MPEDFLADQFEENRAHLTRVAYRMLGSTAEADDAVQEAWLRLSRSESSEIDNLPGWLTTVTARICLNMLRSRATRREDEWDGHLPDPIITREGDPSDEAELADSVGLALLVVLEVLPPAERSLGRYHLYRSALPTGFPSAGDGWGSATPDPDPTRASASPARSTQACGQASPPARLSSA